MNFSNFECDAATERMMLNLGWMLFRSRHMTQVAPESIILQQKPGLSARRKRRMWYSPVPLYKPRNVVNIPTRCQEFG